MRQIVITPVTGKLQSATTEAFRLYVARHKDLFGEEFPVVTVTNRIVIPLIREISEEELAIITTQLTNAGNINSVHLEVVNDKPQEDFVY